MKITFKVKKTRKGLFFKVKLSWKKNLGKVFCKCLLGVAIFAVSSNSCPDLFGKEFWQVYITTKTTSSSAMLG